MNGSYSKVIQYKKYVVQKYGDKLLVRLCKYVLTYVNIYNIVRNILLYVENKYLTYRP